MDSWVVKQLRVQILSDLDRSIPSGYFEQKMPKVKFSEHVKGHEYLSSEMNWGILATKLGQRLHKSPPPGFTARQVSASETLMNLGLLASAEAAYASMKQLSDCASSKGIYDCNSGNVSNQFQTEHIPTFKANVRGALEQYLHYLSDDEMRPYLSLISESRKGDLISMASKKHTTINNTVNVQGSNSGIIQTGEKNDCKTANSSSGGVLKWLVNHLASFIITITGGVIVVIVTKFLL
ncbi:hypothetical protein [Pseudoalteromonas sp. T1lg23B]|uniref:hypothetical protein n=1 Tax=Pseudoalteromonas sp. T1lg23B TaxID=2077097 RepID=UPI000CF60BD2|nr:hypothetical protein [Pseudoalteromonas sp. T1lg23B]